MRVPASDASSASKKTEKPEKNEKSEKSEKASVVTKKKVKKKSEEDDSADAKKADSAKSRGEPSAEVVLSSKGKALSANEREIKHAETLMDQVDSGNLSEADRAKAMTRIGELLKKYGQA